MGVLIFFLIVGIIATYVIFTHRAIEILDKVGCDGTFIEWFACFCPIWHLIIYAKHKDVCEFNTLRKILADLGGQYNVMENKLNRYKK